MGQESNARRSPYPGRGLCGQGITKEGKYYGAKHGYCRLESRDLQYAACLALLSRFTRLSVLGQGFHIVAAVHAHVVHHRHAHRLHGARFCRCLNSRHPAERKRQANHEDNAKPQIAFHGLECSR